MCDKKFQNFKKTKSKISFKENLHYEMYQKWIL